MNRLIFACRKPSLFHAIPNHYPAFRRQGIRRYFASVNIENDSSDQQAYDRGTYKPNFVLQFDQNGRLLVYRANTRSFYIQAIALHILLAYTSYQIIVKWYSNGKFKNILCIFGLALSLVCCVISFRSGRSLLNELHLKSDGKHILYRSFYWPFLREVPIRSIEPQEEMALNFLKMQNVAFLDLPNDVFSLNLDSSYQPYILDNDLLDALLKGKEIVIDEISSETLIDL
jgi:hypothetical protein